MSARRYTVNQNEAINAMTDLARYNQVVELATFLALAHFNDGAKAII